MRIVRAHAIYVLRTEDAVDGRFIFGVCVPVHVEYNTEQNERYFLPTGEGLILEDVQCETKIGDLARVREESLGQARFYVGLNEFPSSARVPFWLFPIIGLGIQSFKIALRIDGFNLFKSAGFQLASWGRFMWGNTVFDDPITPKEHSSAACAQKLHVGDALPIKVDESADGVLVLDGMLDDNEYNASLHVIGDHKVQVGSTIASLAEMTVDGVTAAFRCGLGTVLSKQGQSPHSG